MDSANGLRYESLDWKGWHVEADEGRILFASLSGEEAKNYELGSYIGHFYALAQCLLVTTANQVFCFDELAQMRWQSEWIAVDGVVIHAVEGDVIHGEAEMDPPGGWVPFRLNLRTGKGNNLRRR